MRGRERGDERFEHRTVAGRERLGRPVAVDDDVAGSDVDRRHGVHGRAPRRRHGVAEPHRARAEPEQLDDRAGGACSDGDGVVAATEPVGQVEPDLCLARAVFGGLAEGVEPRDHPSDQRRGQQERAEGDEVVVALDREVPARLREAVDERDEAAGGGRRARPGAEQ